MARCLSVRKLISQADALSKLFFGVIVICPTAVAYSIRQIINSVCLCHSVSVRLSVCTLTVAFLDRFSSEVAQRSQPPNANVFVGGVNTALPLPIFCAQNHHFGQKVLKNLCKHKKANFCLNCSRVAGIPASYKKLGSKNMMENINDGTFLACLSEGEQQSCLL